MAQEEGTINVVIPDPTQADNADVHYVDENGFKNMKMFIGALGQQAIYEVSLSGDNLNVTRSIDIRLRQNNNNGPDQAAAGGAVAPDQHAPAAGEAAPPQAQGRLKITVAAEGAQAQEDDAGKDREYLDKMRGWLMTVATLFVNMAFQAGLHPPNWYIKTELYTSFTRRKAGNWTDSLAAPAASTHPADATLREALRASLYLPFTILTFGFALTVSQVLLWETSSPGHTIRIVRRTMALLSVTAACTFALGTSDNWFLICFVFLVVLANAVQIVLAVLGNTRDYCVTLFRRLVGNRVFLCGAPQDAHVE